MKIVETNVAIAANGKSDHASLSCQLTCIEFLSELVAGKELIVVDDLGLIMDEYSRYLNYSGQPDVGDEFFKYLNDHQYYEEKVCRVTITENTNAATGFDELPVNTMDPSDRKFLAAAYISGAEVVNALDNDWHEKRSEIEKMRVKVMQLCPDQGCRV